MTQELTTCPGNGVREQRVEQGLRAGLKREAHRQSTFPQSWCSSQTYYDDTSTLRRLETQKGQSAIYLRVSETQPGNERVCLHDPVCTASTVENQREKVNWVKKNLPPIFSLILYTWTQYTNTEGSWINIEDYSGSQGGRNSILSPPKSQEVKHFLMGKGSCS